MGDPQQFYVALLLLAALGLIGGDPDPQEPLCSGDDTCAGTIQRMACKGSWRFRHPGCPDAPPLDASSCPVLRQSAQAVYRALSFFGRLAGLVSLVCFVGRSAVQNVAIAGHPVAPRQRAGALERARARHLATGTPPHPAVQVSVASLAGTDPTSAS